MNEEVYYIDIIISLKSICNIILITLKVVHQKSKVISKNTFLGMLPRSIGFYPFWIMPRIQDETSCKALCCHYACIIHIDVLCARNRRSIVKVPTNKC